MDSLGRGLVARRHHIEPLERVWLFAGAGFIKIGRGVGELRREFGDEVGGDFVAARADGRANGGEKIGGIAAELEAHAADGFLQDARERAAPSGVNRRDGALLWIDKKDGDAVGSLNTEQQAAEIRGGGVALARSFGRFAEKVDDIRVDLLERGEFEILRVDRGLEEAAIFEDVFARVPLHEAEVEDFFGFESTDAAGARAEAVDEPGDLAKSVEFENLEFTGGAQAPGSGDAGSRGFRVRAGPLATGRAAFAGAQRWLSLVHNLISIIATEDAAKNAAARGS